MILPSTVTEEEEERIEPTPVVVMAGGSVTSHVMWPLEGSEGSGGGGEGGGGGGYRYGRLKREYSLEDFLIWLPSGKWC